MAAKVPELSYSCEICGADGLSDEEMRIHVMICHLKNAVACPFCNSENMTEDEMLTHVNTAHLDYLTPEQELLTFIDDGDELLSPLSESRWETKDGRNGLNNNNNNNNEFYNAQGKKLKNGDIPSWGSPQRSQLALNLRTNTAPAVPKTNLQYMFECPLCTYRGDTVSNLEEHINRQHFDLTSPSVNPDLASKHHSLYSCPLCVNTFENTPDLELHVNIEHKDVLSPAKPVHDIIQDKISTECPICCMSNFKSTDELAYHIDQHFNPKGASPLTPDVSCDRLLAKEMEKRDKEVQRLREQHEFELLRAQYGMDNEGNFKEQSLTNMQRAVYSGELSVADYYERQIELKMAESNGVDDGSSCTKETTLAVLAKVIDYAVNKVKDYRNMEFSMKQSHKLHNNIKINGYWLYLPDIIPDVVELIAAVSTSSSNVARTLLCSKVDHYASTYGDRGWGCGYRNTQMMLSSLVHHTGYNEQLYKQWLLGRNPELPSRSAMPSISRLQEHIEWAWKEGFDVQGADQLGGKLVNTRKWIGATEVVTVLSSLRIRCQLVDFHRPTSANGSHPEMFKWVLDYFQAYDDFKPPLYLQHQGHSRTIIGVEELRGGGENLIILDPSHSPAQMTGLRLTSTAQGVLGLLRKPLSAMKAKQYQVVAVAGIMDSEVEYQNSKVLRSVRVPPDRP